MPDITARAEERIMISDAWLNTHRTEKKAVCDCETLTPPSAFIVPKRARSGRNGRFEPRGVSMNGRYDSEQEDKMDDAATDAHINCEYKNDPVAYKERFACGITHPASIRRIYAYDTTARQIFIKA